MAGKPEPLQAFLQRRMQGSLLQQMDVQKRLLRAVRDALPDTLSAHCLHCLGRGDCLILYVDSPAWASQIRFYGPHLLLQLGHSAGLRYREVRIRNVVPLPRFPEDKATAPAHSPGAGILVLESAAGIAESELRTALLRLGRTLTGSGRKT